MDKKFTKALTFTLSVIMGALFIFSAYSKTQPIEYFEFTLVDQLHLPDRLAFWAARFFIGVELGLGFLLLLNVSGKKKWVLKTSIGLMILFTIHLILLLFNVGNDVNCGCMGSLVPMSPGISILKNVAILIILIIIHTFSRADRDIINNRLSLLTFVVLTAIPFFIFQQKKELSFTKLKAEAKSEIPNVTLGKGNQFIGFLSLSCSHCRHAATYLSDIKKKHPEFNIFFVYLNPPENIKEDMYKDFINSTHADNIPYIYMDEKPFIGFAGTQVPALLWIKDSTIVRKLNIPELNEKEIISWLSK